MENQSTLPSAALVGCIGRDMWVGGIEATSLRRADAGWQSKTPRRAALRSGGRAGRGRDRRASGSRNGRCASCEYDPAHHVAGVAPGCRSALVSSRMDRHAAVSAWLHELREGRAWAEAAGLRRAAPVPGGAPGRRGGNQITISRACTARQQRGLDLSIAPGPIQ